MKIKTWMAACGLAVCLLAQPVAAGQFEDATAAHERGDYATALRLLRPLADRGDARAQYNLGVMYNKGDGVSQDFAEAAKWFRKAADQGLADAQTQLGMIYDFGVKGVPPDYAEAVKWYRKAAEQGDAKAQNLLGALYYEGRHLPQDYAEALKWYGKAGDQGDANAQFYLGVMYFEGQGVPQDYVQAHMWLNLAVAGSPTSDPFDSRDNAVHVRDIIAAKMTPDQIAEAQRLARKWLAAHPKP